MLFALDVPSKSREAVHKSVNDIVVGTVRKRAHLSYEGTEPLSRSWETHITVLRQRCHSGRTLPFGSRADAGVTWSP
jgi:hypothetical protein